MLYIKNFNKKKLSIDLVPNAIVTPLNHFDTKHRTFDGGVFCEAGNLIDSSVQVKAGYKNIPEGPPKTVVSYLKGKWIFGGMLQNRHFGHFMIESLNRVWASEKLRVDGILFYCRTPEAGVKSFVFDSLKEIVGDLEIHIVRADSSVEELYIPTPTCHERQGYLLNHPVLSTLTQRIINRFQSPNMPKLVYVSRGQLRGHEGGILGETVIEDYLKKSGYYIMYPERLSVKEQLSIYANAEKIIFADGSAFHLFVLVSNSNQKVFCIWRRKIHHDFNFQLFSFTGKKVIGSCHVLGVYVPRDKPNSSARQKARLNFEELHNELKRNEFVAQDSILEELTDEYIHKEVENLEKVTGKQYSFLMGNGL